MFSLVIDWLHWVFFSWHGAMARGRENVDAQVQLAFLATHRPLIKQHCEYCNVVYWAYTKGNKYCGAFKCFRKVIHAVSS
jgi:hypothetical protein